MKKLFAMLLAFAMVMSLVACGGGKTIENPNASTEAETKAEETKADASEAASGAETEAAETEAEAKPIVIASSMTFETVDPGKDYEGDADMVLHAVYDSLVTTDAADESVIVPCVAKEWTVSPDGKTYVFTLRDDITFTTGKNLTAEDAAYAINRIIGIQSVPSFLLENVESCEATGDYELTLVLKEVDPSILAILTRATFGIYDSEVAKANGGSCDENDTLGDYFDNNESIGSGAFKITSYEAGQNLVLEKNDNAVLKQASTDKIIYRNISDAGTQQMELEAGDIDFAFDLTADQVAVIEDNENINIVTSASYDLFFFMMNASEEYGKELADPKVREAISYAIDYDGFLSLCPEGSLRPANVVQKGFLGYAGDATKTRDVEKAKELLAEAGVENLVLNCTTVADLSVDGISFVDVATKIQADLQEVGITMNVDSAAVSVYLEQYRNGQAQCLIGEWGPDFNDANNQLAFAPGNTVGLRAGWEAEMAPEAADLASQAAVEIDTAKREQLLLDWQAAMDEAVSPFIVMVQPGRAWATSSRLQGVTVSSAFYVELTDLYY